jgi:hypothetical protein
VIRRVTVAVVALALVVGAGTSWAVSAHGERVAAQQAAEERVGAALDAAMAEDDAARDLSGRAAGADVDALLVAARTDLETASAAGRSALDASAGKVADDAVRAQLAAALDAADAALSGAPAAAHADALTAAVTTATAQVVAAQQDWEAQQAAAAAAAAAARAGSGSGSAAGGISCATTYQGPVFYTSAPTPDGDGSNGRIPASAMAAVSWTVDSQGSQFWLRADATAALERLNAAFTAQFGHGLDLDLAYRDYATQVAMRDALGSIAAKPGTSRHGTGTAIDVPELPCSYGWNTPQRTWLVTHGPSYGWASPSWSRENGSNPEYWHYEFTG